MSVVWTGTPHGNERPKAHKKRDRRRLSLKRVRGEKGGAVDIADELAGVG